MTKLPKYCTFCGRILVMKYAGIIECLEYDKFLFGTDERHDRFYIRDYDPMINFDPYTGERK